MIKLFDFSENLSITDKISNVFLGLGFLLFWVTIMVFYMDWLFPYYELSQIIPYNSFSRLFTACFLAPVWESLVYVWMPVIAAKRLNIELLPVIITSSIIFGLGHGGVMNILIQGVGGLVFSWIYLKNQNIGWSMILHAVYNFYVIYLCKAFC